MFETILAFGVLGVSSVVSLITLFRIFHVGEFIADVWDVIVGWFRIASPSKSISDGWGQSILSLEEKVQRVELELNIEGKMREKRFAHYKEVKAWDLVFDQLMREAGAPTPQIGSFASYGIHADVERSVADAVNAAREEWVSFYELPDNVIEMRSFDGSRKYVLNEGGRVRISDRSETVFDAPSGRWKMVVYERYRNPDGSISEDTASETWIVDVKGVSGES